MCVLRLSLDAEQKDELMVVLERLLNDNTTLVMGSAVMAFEEVGHINSEFADKTLNCHEQY